LTHFEYPGEDVSWELEWAEFKKAILENRPPLGNGQDGFKANRVIEAIYESSHKQQPIKIE